MSDPRCSRCGTSYGQVHRLTETGEWLCGRCFFSGSGGQYLDEHPATRTTAGASPSPAPKDSTAGSTAQIVNLSAWRAGWRARRVKR